MNTRKTRGFALPTVLISSIVMLMVLISAVTSVVATRVSLKGQYYNRMAQDAGEAGVAYARACMKLNGNAPTWTDLKPLKPNTDCNGDIAYACTENSIDPRCSVAVIDDKTIASFSVARPIADSSGSFVNSDIVSKGTIGLLRPDSSLWRSYSASSTGQLVKKLKVTFDSQGGSVVLSKMASAGSLITAPTAPTKSGSVFGGWYKEIDHTNAWNFATDTVTTNRVLYAKWSTNALTSIGAITGTPQIGQTLTTGAVTPGGATVSYQWYSSATVGGVYDVIAGATASTYVVSPNVMGKYIKVVATGTGSYSGTQTSVATAQVPVDSTNWIAIGTQTWAKANLNVGTRIAGTTAQANNATLEKYCYNDTESNCTTYGGLYQWGEAMNYNTAEGAQGICPAGSHVPSDNDWKALEVSLGMSSPDKTDSLGWRMTVYEGTSLKVGGSSGLNIRLAGYRYATSGFGDISSSTFLWTSSESSLSAWTRRLNADQNGVFRGTLEKGYGFSVRCLGN